MPEAQNPELGIPDAVKILEAIAEAVLSGQGTTPPVKIRVAHQDYWVTVSVSSTAPQPVPAPGHP